MVDNLYLNSLVSRLYSTHRLHSRNSYTSERDSTLRDRVFPKLYQNMGSTKC